MINRHRSCGCRLPPQKRDQPAPPHEKNCRENAYGQEPCIQTACGMPAPIFTLIIRHIWLFTKTRRSPSMRACPKRMKTSCSFLYPSPLKEGQKPFGNGKGSLQCAQCVTEMDAALIEHVWKAPCPRYVCVLRNIGTRFPQRKRKDTGTPHRRSFPFQLL